MDPRTEKPLDEEIDVFGVTHTGKKRKENQDHFLICSLHKEVQVHNTSLSNLDQLPLGRERLAFLGLVADGVGSGAGGEEASKRALQCVLGFVGKSMQCYYTHDPDDAEDFTTALETTVQQCHAKVLEEAQKHPEQGTMATTLTMILSVWPRAYFVQVGDSRAYQLREGKLRQITRDQTMAQELVDRGALEPQEAQASRLAHVLSSAIGGPTATPVVTKVDNRIDDVVLLCSDGLTKHVSDDEIRDSLMTIESSEEACRKLLDDALDRGGTDNITVLVGRMKASALAKRQQELVGAA